ncbi:MAG: hypothetical protein R3A47_09000 [Polyangiales bacterium]
MSEDDDDLDFPEEEASTKIGVPPIGIESLQRTLSGAVAPPADPERVLVPEGIAFRFYGKSDVGLVREHNEDNFLIVDLSSGDLQTLGQSRESSGAVHNGGLVFGVCDGMGGAAAGRSCQSHGG